jgi:hypothetical protein
MMPHSQEASDNPHANPSGRLQLNDLRLFPTRDGLNGVHRILVPPQQHPWDLASIPTPPPFSGRQGGTGARTTRYDHLPACCSFTDILSRLNSSIHRPDTPREKRTPAKTPLRSESRNALVVRNMPEPVEESSTSEDDEGKTPKESSDLEPEPETSGKKKIQPKSKRKWVKKGWDRMWKPITGLRINKPEDSSNRALLETSERWQSVKSALSNRSCFFDFAFTTRSALQEVRYSRVLTPAQSREFGRLASRSTLNIGDETALPPLPKRRPERTEPVVQSTASPSRRRRERRPSDNTECPFL